MIGDTAEAYAMTVYEVVHEYDPAVCMMSRPVCTISEFQHRHGGLSSRYTCRQPLVLSGGMWRSIAAGLVHARTTPYLGKVPTLRWKR